MRLITSEDDLTVSSLQNLNYAGAVNYVQTIIEHGKIIQELPEVPEQHYSELLCVAMEQLKLYDPSPLAPHRRQGMGARAGLRSLR